MRALLLVLLAGAGSCATPAPPPARPAPTSGMAAEMAYLVSDQLEGRQVGSAGADSAAAFLVDRYVQLGLSGPFTTECPSEAACLGQYAQSFRISGVEARNIAAVVPGSDPTLAGQWVVIGAHVDHLGRSGRGARDPEEGLALRRGADDNASGTVALLELGKRLAADPAPVSVMLVHFDAEELGMVGSGVFVDDPPVPLDSMVLMINLDMVGRLRRGPLLVEPTYGAEPFVGTLEVAAAAASVPLEISRAVEGRSDHRSFERRRVPAIALFTGFHPDYHRVTDTADKVDLLGIVKIVDLTEGLVRALRPGG